MKTNRFARYNQSVSYALLGLILLCTFSLKAQTLRDFSWQSSDTSTGAQNVTYTFSYTITTPSPDMIFYALSTNEGIDTIKLGQPLNPNKISVTIDSVPAEIDTKTSGNMDQGVLLRLKDQTLAKAGSRVVVALQDVTNNVNPGTYAWEWVKTADKNGKTTNRASAIAPLEITGEYHDHYLKDFIWNSSDITAGAKNVTYTFSYKINASQPDYIFDAATTSRAIDTNAIGQPFDTSMISIMIDGVPAHIDLNRSFNRGNRISIKLKNKALAKSGSHIVVKLHGVVNGARPGTYPWHMIKTGTRPPRPYDKAENPAPIKIIGEPYDNELKDFSWHSSDTSTGATDVTYTFSYTIVTKAPNMIFYGLADSLALNSSALGRRLDSSKVEVTIDGKPVKINTKTSSNYNSGVFIRLTNPRIAKAGSKVVVKLKGIRNGNSPGSYQWNRIQTSRPSGQAEDKVTSPKPIVLTGEPVRHYLKDFTLHSSNTKAGAKNVTYTFSYQIVTPSPRIILQALARNKAIDTSALGSPIDSSKVEVTVDGKPVEISKRRSKNYNNGLSIVLENPYAVKSGSKVVVKLHGITNNATSGVYGWSKLQTAIGRGHPADRVKANTEITLTAE